MTILLNIFSYSCMNCIRSLKYIKKIDKKYNRYGLKTILVHTPEWEFEKDKRNIACALKKYNIKFPVIIDNKKTIIKGLGINFWPAQLLLMNRKITYRHIGEGGYKKLEDKIIGSLKSKKYKPSKIFNKEPNCAKFSTIYLGKRKNGKIKSLNNKLTNNKLKFGVVYKKGDWRQEKEYLRTFKKGENSIFILTKGRKANITAESLNNKVVDVKIKLNGRLKNIKIKYGRMYALLDNLNIAKNTNKWVIDSVLCLLRTSMYCSINYASEYRIYPLELTTYSDNLAIYSFTFEHNDKGKKLVF